MTQPNTELFQQLRNLRERADAVELAAQEVVHTQKGRITTLRQQFRDIAELVGIDLGGSAEAEADPYRVLGVQRVMAAIQGIQAERDRYREIVRRLQQVALTEVPPNRVVPGPVSVTFGGRVIQ
ncbi:hypothetical protein [Actinoplanes sp. NPDC026670]|uniref:hypothetical protein n=1 Tax=Actinoplanes sp. NPDC026670 TaxID=3154700 RepID=UPI0033FE812F